MSLFYLIRTAGQSFAPFISSKRSDFAFSFSLSRSPYQTNLLIRGINWQIHTINGWNREKQNRTKQIYLLKCIYSIFESLMCFCLIFLFLLSGGDGSFFPSSLVFFIVTKIGTDLVYVLKDCEWLERTRWYNECNTSKQESI